MNAISLPPKQMGKRLMHNGITIETNTAAVCDHTGGDVWKGALALICWMEENTSMIVGKTILELGAGTGVVGMSAALLGAEKVVVTDTKGMQSILLRNLRINEHLWIRQQQEGEGEGEESKLEVDKKDAESKSRVAARVLDWTEPLPEWIDNNDIETEIHDAFDLIVASDVIYEEDGCDALAELLPKLCRHRAMQCVISFSYRAFRLEPIFWAKIEHHFVVTDVTPDSKSKFDREGINVYLLTLKAR